MLKISKSKTSLKGIILTIVTVLASIPIATVHADLTFHPKSTLISMFKSLCDSHPTQASYAVIGKSYENRDIYIFRIGNPNGGTVMWDGSMHGWEDIGSEVEYLMANWLLTSNTIEATRILERNYILFIPIVNMDSENRENHDFEDDRYGVDLNRNFLTGFRYVPPVNTGYPNSYHGDYGGSEPETQAVRNAFQIYQPKIYVNTHYGGGPYLRSCGTNLTLSNLIKTRINEISEANSFTFPWPITSGGAGGGLAVADGNSYGANSWIWEIASENLPIETDGSDCYYHTAHDLATIQSYFFPKMLPALEAMSEAVEIDTQNLYSLTITHTGGKGWTDPLPGTYTYGPGSSVSVAAYDNEGWEFAYWMLDDVNVGASNPIAVTMNSNHVVKPMYTPILPAPTPTPSPTVTPTPIPTSTPSPSQSPSQSSTLTSTPEPTLEPMPTPPKPSENSSSTISITGTITVSSQKFQARRII